MKNTILTIFSIIAIIGCQQTNSFNGSYGNTEWDQNSALSGKGLIKALEGKDSLFTTVT